MGDIIRARRKPIEAEAIQWTGHNIVQILTFAVDHRTPVLEHEERIFLCNSPYREEIHLGDYIVVSSNGEVHCCAPDVFHRNYDIISKD